MTDDTKHNQSPSEMFEQRIADQIRDQIGDLVPEEMLREKVSKVIDGVFFSNARYAGQDNYQPTHYMHKLVGELIEDLSLIHI